MPSIGKIKINNPLILAPMADITTPSFRLLCKDYGAGLVITEMVSANCIVHNREPAERAIILEEEKPAAVQLFGSDPNLIFQAAKKVQSDIIDFNCGCPSLTITKQSAGSALLNKPELIKEIVKSCSTLNKPFMVKIRISKDIQETIRLAKIIEQAGAGAITIHARTPQQGYSGKADWNAIKIIKENISIPVIGNGDINSPEKCKKMLDICDFAMIGRAAAKSPFIFRQCLTYLKTGDLVEQSYEEKLKDFNKLLCYFQKYGDGNFPKIKRRAMDFSKGKGPKLRDKLARTKDIEELKKLLEK